MKRRILFLISDTGGGHRSVASAIAQVLEEKYGFECLLPDFFKEGTKPPFKNFPYLYARITKEINFFWGLLWYFAYPPFWYKTLNCLVDFFSPNGLKEFYAANHPFSAVVSCHALFNHFPLKALRESPYREVPFFVVVVDLVSLHTGWIAKEADFVFLPNTESERVFRKKGFDSRKMGVYGYPVKREFTIDQDKKEAKGNKVVLIIGGGEGVGKIEDCANLFIKKTEYEIIIISGRNEKLFRRLKDTYQGETRVKVLGFVENMHSLLSAADICVTKAGPSTIMEAVAKRVPLILMNYSYGQEAGNVRWVEEKRIGFYEPKPEKIIEKAREILETDLGEKIQRRMERIRSFNFNAAERIGDKIVELIGG